MSTPQLEDGYTRIANELLEALARVRIPGEANQVLNVIFRKTYGFHKKEDRISLGQFSEATGLSRQHVSRALNALTSMQIVTKKGYNLNVSYGFNKNYLEWQPLPKKVTGTVITSRPSIRPFCYVCGFAETLEDHHITPRAEGGSNRVANRLNLCPNCHSLTHKGKYSRDQLLTVKGYIENKPFSISPIMDNGENLTLLGSGSNHNWQKPAPLLGTTKDTKETTKEKTTTTPTAVNRLTVRETSILFNQYAGVNITNGGQIAILNDFARDYTPEAIKEAFEFAAAANIEARFFLPYCRTRLARKQEQAQKQAQEHTEKAEQKANLEIEIGSIWQGTKSGNLYEVTETFGVIVYIRNTATGEEDSLDRSIILNPEKFTRHG